MQNLIGWRNYCFNSFFPFLAVVVVIWVIRNGKRTREISEDNNRTLKEILNTFKQTKLTPDNERRWNEFFGALRGRKMSFYDPYSIC